MISPIEALQQRTAEILDEDYQAFVKYLEQELAEMMLRQAKSHYYWVSPHTVGCVLGPGVARSRSWRYAVGHRLATELARAGWYVKLQQVGDGIRLRIYPLKPKSFRFTYGGLKFGGS